MDKLLHPDPKLAPMLEKLRSASKASRTPYRTCETNSFCGGGKPGVSDTFGAALWVLDFMFSLASAGCAGVNIETGVNQLGFISSYSPIADDERGTYSAKPEYYGMLAFAQASQGQLLAVDCDAANINLTAYAVVHDWKRLSLQSSTKRYPKMPTCTSPSPNASRARQYYASLGLLSKPKTESRWPAPLSLPKANGSPNAWNPLVTRAAGMRSGSLPQARRF
jgi:hypothetical protein